MRLVMKTIRSSSLLIAMAFTLCFTVTASAQHFDPPPATPFSMPIYLIEVKYNGQDMEAGDEIGIFDEFCVCKKYIIAGIDR